MGRDRTIEQGPRRPAVPGHPNPCFEERRSQKAA